MKFMQAWSYAQNGSGPCCINKVTFSSGQVEVQHGILSCQAHYAWAETMTHRTISFEYVLFGISCFLLHGSQITCQAVQFKLVKITNVIIQSNAITGWWPHTK